MARRVGVLVAVALAVAANGCGSGDRTAARAAAATEALAGAPAATAAGGRAEVALRVTVTGEDSGVATDCVLTVAGPAGPAAADRVTASGRGPAGEPLGPLDGCRAGAATTAALDGLVPPAVLSGVADLGTDRLIGPARVDGVAATEYEGVAPGRSPTFVSGLYDVATDIQPGVVVDVWLDRSGRLVRYRAELDLGGLATGVRHSPGPVTLRVTIDGGLSGAKPATPAAGTGAGG